MTLNVLKYVQSCRRQAFGQGSAIIRYTFYRGAVLAKPLTLLLSIRTSVTISKFSTTKHETWRDEHDTDNVPKVKKRDGTFGQIDKNRVCPNNTICFYEYLKQFKFKKI